MTQRKRPRCKARTKSGSRCKNRASTGREGFCARHVPASSRGQIVSASYCPPDKSLFKLVVDEQRLHTSFRLLRTAAGYEPARRMLDDVFQAFQDPDGNFLEQFQTTGFDSRCFELYLFAYFARSGFDIDRTNPMPDFLVAREGVRVAVEATTVNRPTGVPYRNTADSSTN